MDVDSLSPTTDDTCSSQSSDKDSGIEADIELQDILKLHRQVNDDIELKLKTTDKNFRACYMKYLEVYRNVISKARGQAPVAALATAFVNFGKDRHGLTLPILHNSRARIRVQTHVNIKKKVKDKIINSTSNWPKPSFKG
ncbi:hypothetical protein OS493_009727 [Desmophyllum pertusum]|uniref:Uncharacterized protein n=1 Tax=Desmophyllum pertusum TaxID=174260 RepID=A0A9W9YRA7_9CNID|nr:hypothetical protein OS493_009727 [Desmophyllum pertusum]